jgi:hypothetical protein
MEKYKNGKRLTGQAGLDTLSGWPVRPSSGSLPGFRLGHVAYHLDDAVRVE